MNIKLVIFKMLLYYDRPNLFLTKDQFGTVVLSMAVEENKEDVVYLGTPISENRLQDFFSKKIALKEIFEKPESNIIYKFCETIFDGNSYTAEIIDSIPANWQPDANSFFNFQKIADNQINLEAKQLKKGIIYFTLNKDSKHHIIPASLMSISVKIFQELIKYAYKKSLLSNSQKNISQNISDSYELDIFAFSPGSFKIHLQTHEDADFWGYSEIKKALLKLDQIIVSGKQETLLRIFKDNRGYLISYYRKLLEFILNNNCNIKYEWAMPDDSTKNEKTIDIKFAKPIYELLSQKKELEIEKTKISGRFIKVNSKSGTWEIRNDVEKKNYRGKGLPEKLKGVIIDKATYELVCEEKNEEDYVSGHDKTYFIIKNLKLIK